MSGSAGEVAPLVTVERDAGVATLRLERPKVNALSIALLRELVSALEGLHHDLPGALVVTGGARIFAAGAEITELAEAPSGIELADLLHEALNLLSRLPRPTIAAVNGVAFGGGLELALACDLRFVADDARLGFPEILLGLFPGGGGTQRLPRLVGAAVAKEMVFTGREVGAQEARAIRLADAVHPSAAVLGEAQTLAARLASGPLIAIALAKRAIDEGLDGDLAAGLRRERELFARDARHRRRPARDRLLPRLWPRPRHVQRTRRIRVSTLERIGIVGLGLMGVGIAEVTARAGCDVVVVESDPAALDGGLARLDASLARAVSSGKLDDAARDAARARVRAVGDLDVLADRQLVIEAVVEDEQVKRSLFQTLDEIVEDERAIFASNTSTIPIVKMAMATARPESVLGMHFFNPVPVMPLVELISSVRTAPEVAARAEEFASARLGKSVIHAEDRAGFIVNGLLIPYLLSAVRMLEGRFASAGDIDEGMVKGCNHPLGPLALCDFIGLDTVVLCAESIYDEHRDPAFATPPLLARMVEGGLLGRKSGRGFYTYG